MHRCLFTTRGHTTLHSVASNYTYYHTANEKRTTFVVSVFIFDLASFFSISRFVTWHVQYFQPIWTGEKRSVLCTGFIKSNTKLSYPIKYPFSLISRLVYSCSTCKHITKGILGRKFSVIYIHIYGPLALPTVAQQKELFTFCLKLNLFSREKRVSLKNVK